MNSMNGGSFVRKKKGTIIKELKFYAYDQRCGIEIGDSMTAKEEKFFSTGEFLPDFKNGQAGWFISCGRSSDVPPGFPTWRSEVVGVTGDIGRKPSKRKWPNDWGPVPKNDWKEMLRIDMKIITPTEYVSVRRIFTGAAAFWSSIGEFYDKTLKDKEDKHPADLLSMILTGWKRNTELWNPNPDRPIYSPVFEPGSWMPRSEDLPDEPMELIDVTSVAKEKDDSGKGSTFADEDDLEAFGIRDDDPPGADDYR